MEKPVDHFDDPKQLIGHARDHINALDAKIKAFFDSKPHAPIVEFDRKTGQQVYKVRLIRLPPSNLTLVLKDAVSNLRDALDHATYASAVALGNPDPRCTGFPFADHAAGVQGELNGSRLRDIPPEIHPILKGFEPHKAGNHLLWGLNKMRVTKTHRLLVPLATAAVGMNMTVSSGVLSGGSMGYSRWDPAKNEVEYMRLGPGSQMNYEVNIAFNILFGDIEVVGGKPAISTLNEMASEVERVVLAIEAETNRVLAARKS